MANSLTSLSESEPRNDLARHRQLRRVRHTVAECGPIVLLVVAIAYAGVGLLLRSESLSVNPLFHSAIHTVALFATGLAPMLGAALVVWLSRHSLSPAERRSWLLGAATSAALFLPALLLVRTFG
jgi:hypothetical protein